MLLFTFLISLTSLLSQNFDAVNISSNFEDPNMAETIDLNGDGLDDILAAGSTKFYYYENIGNAQFTKHSLVDTIDGFWRFSTFDWENDGDLDIFFTSLSYGNQKAAWLENDGNENFTYHLIVDTIISPFLIKPFDIDQDNDVDIFLSSSETDELYWLKNDGSDNFTMDTIGPYVNQFEIADLDGDNDWDFIFGRAYTGVTISEVRAHQNDGNNNFSMITLKSGFSTISEIIVEDVNGDNYFDIVVPDYNGDALSWLKNDGSYGFASKTIIMNNFDGPTGVSLKDVNGNGKKDIIAGSYNDDEMYIFYGQGSTSSYGFSSGYLIYDELNMISDVSIGNFDNQNNMDFMHTDKGNDQLSIWINDGSQNFTQNIESISFDSPRAFDMQDLDGDGDQDMAAVSNDGDMVVWFENVGDDNFEQHVLITHYEEPYVVRINDLDDDGDNDIIAASNDDDRVTWWQNDGSGNFTMAHLTTSVNGPRDIWIEDFDGDGDKDVAVICYWLYYVSGNTGLQLLKNDGNENFTLHEIEEDIRSGSGMRGADMNGDSITDLVISSAPYTGSELVIAVNGGTGFGIIDIDDLLCQDFEIVDFDGDQDNDILAIDYSLDSLYFYENLGSWQFYKHTVAYIEDLYGIAPRDYDNDGDMDVIFSTGYSGFTNGSGFEWGIFRNDGTGALTQETWYQNLSITKPMEVFDFENDGDFDVVIGFDYADKITMYKNLDINCPLSVSIAASGAVEFCDGGSVLLEASTNDVGITYQWYKDGIALLNDTLDNLLADESGLYQVEIADTTCAILSNTIEVVEHPTFIEDVYTSICTGESLVYDSITITTAGVYTLNLLSGAGCDSTVTLHVSVSDNYLIPSTASICDGSSYDFNGTILNAAGTYFDTLQTVQGCDSVLELTLSVNPVYNTPLSASICDGDNYDFNGTILNAAGTYFDTLQTVLGCDSVLELTLMVNPVYTTPLSASICDGTSYDFNGTILTAAGTYFDTLQTVLGCDSVLELTLTVNPIYTTPLSASICDGANYDFNGTILNASGTYFDTLQTVLGCDSVLELTLTVNPVYTTPLSASICDGDNYDFNGTILNAAGTYFDTLQTVQGCDSVLELTLSVNPVYNTPLSASICDGDDYDFNGTILSVAGTYFDTLQTVLGCDSVLELTLSVDPVYTTPLSASICDGDNYGFNGTILNAAGTYFDTLQTVHGCDSVLELTLSVNPVYTTPLAASICDGDNYDFNGTILNAAGTYFDTLQTVLGCDSVLELTLSVNPVYTTPLSASICDGDNYDFNGTILNAAGMYFDTMQTVLGCDSVMVLTLTVNPLPMVDLGTDTTILDTETMTLDAGSGFVAYHWQDASTAQTFVVDGPVIGQGTYEFWVEVRDANSCANSDTIIITVIDDIGVEIAEKTSIKVFPNPVKDVVKVEFPSAGQYQLMLFDASGRMLRKEETSFSQHSIDMNNLATGDYYLKIITLEQTITVPLIKVEY